MKRIFFAIVLVSSVIGTVLGLNYYIALTTYTPTDSAVNFTLGGYPNIADGAYIDKITISNDGEANQLVTIYDNCTSSTAATIAYRVLITSASVSKGFIDINFNSFNPLKLRNVGATKSSTGSNVYLNIQYK